MGYPHEVKGEALCAFVVLKTVEALHAVQTLCATSLADELKNYVSKQIGPVAKPDQIRFTENLPKTRSGKIMRRLLRDIASGKQTVGDTTTLEDVSVLEKLRAEEE